MLHSQPDAPNYVLALEELERHLDWHSLLIDGHIWKWLDTGGNGAVAMLLPGSVGDGGMFVSTLSALGSSFRLVSVTYPALFEPEKLADGLSLVMGHLRIESALVVGSSFAAFWAQYFALRHPQKVSGLVIGNGLVDGNDLTYDPLFAHDYLESVSPKALHEAWIERVGSPPITALKHFQKFLLTKRQTPENLYARLRGVGKASACPPLSLPMKSITVLDCDDDPLIPFYVRERMRLCYPGANHITFTVGGHYPHLLNQIEYQSLLVEILKGISPARISV